jgi:hypothetical protein
MPVLANFAIQCQGKAGNLCWACVGLGIASFCDQLSNQPLRWGALCDYVMAVLSSHYGTPPSALRCCDDDRLTKSVCNRTFWLPDALALANNQGSVIDGALEFEAVKAQIDLNRPIGVEIATSIGNHVIVIFGYDETDGQRVMVADPAPDAYGSNLLLYDELLHDYRQSGGQWNQSYLTVATNA